MVGETPVLAPGEGFAYMSSARISSKFGSMEGTFRFKNRVGEYFEVPVEKCKLTPAEFGLYLAS